MIKLLTALYLRVCEPALMVRSRFPQAYYVRY